MSNETTLLPCPFCGGEAEIIESDYGMYLTGYAIYCRKCCLKLGVTGRLGEAYEWTPVFNEAEAIEAWNTRAERTCRWTPADYITEGEWWNTSCGGSFTWEPDGTPNYCPGCGARVELKSAESTNNG